MRPSCTVHAPPACARLSASDSGAISPGRHVLNLNRQLTGLPAQAVLFNPEQDSGATCSGRLVPRNRQRSVLLRPSRSEPSRSRHHSGFVARAQGVRIQRRATPKHFRVARGATSPTVAVAPPGAPAARGWSPVVDPCRRPQRPRAAAAEPLATAQRAAPMCRKPASTRRSKSSTRAGAPQRPVAGPGAYANRPTDTKREYSKLCLAFHCLASRPLPLSHHRIRGTVRRSPWAFVFGRQFLNHF
jgi:hypothetical protein